MPLENYELATVDVPDDPATRARFEELVRPDGVELAPSASYEASDPTDCVTVVVDRSAKVTAVRLRSGWAGQVRPDTLPGVVYDTYTAAVQRAVAVELTRRADDSSGSAPRPEAEYIDPGLPLDEWVARVRARLDAIEDERDAIRRHSAPPPPQDSEVRSPSGTLTLHLRGSSPVSITGDVLAQGAPLDDALATDFQRLFAAAGLGTGGEGAETPVSRRPRRGRGGRDDDDYFGDFNILRDED